MEKDLNDIDLNTLSRLTNEDFKNFLLKVVKNHNCPSCSTTSWAMVGGETETLAILTLGKNGEFNLPPAFIPVMAVACNNCGYVKQHSKSAVARWKSGTSGVK